jgi:hypothetical protein
MALELKRDSLVFSFPDVHPDCSCTITFVRTLRIPDDNKTYPLPPGLGPFPLKHVDDFADRIPAKWKDHGGIMLPMYQSEAMWLQFSVSRAAAQGNYPFAIKVATGKRSALTGEDWSPTLREKDYCVAPKQPWLDGYVIDKDTIRQFVAAPLGMGFSAEEQITGKADHGGLQIEVMPMKREVFDRRFPKREEQKTRGGVLRTASLGFNGTKGVIEGVIAETNEYSSTMDFMSLDCERGIDGPVACAAAAAKPDMGLAPGGRMKQEVFEDPYDFNDWDRSQHGRCFVHLSNSLAWRAITKNDPPTAPRTALEYTRYGLPWFDLYQDGTGLDGTKLTKELKSVMALGFQKGFSILPENEAVEFKSDQIVKVRAKGEAEVRDGKWAE